VLPQRGGIVAWHAQTLLCWHRTLVRRKWTSGKERPPGRPPIDSEVVALALRMAREHARWGCVRIGGELRKLGIRVGATTIRTLLRRHGLGPAPRRLGPTWARFLQAQAEGIVACDLFTVAAIRRKTLHVLFFIQLRIRRVVAAAVTAHPDSGVGHPAGQERRDGPQTIGSVGQVLLGDHHAKFTGSFDEVFSSEVGRSCARRSGRRKRTPLPSAGSRQCGAECLDWTLVLGRRYLMMNQDFRVPQVATVTSLSMAGLAGVLLAAPRRPVAACSGHRDAHGQIRP
jgi:putative transposase